MKRNGKKLLLLLLSVLLALPMGGTSDILPAEGDMATCVHVHGEDCGYRESTACTHAHGGGCGYTETSDCSHAHEDGCYKIDTTCDHAHDANCGYVKASNCGHTHGDACYAEEPNCTHAHGDGCGYAEATACAHAHDEACGEDGTACAHAHDETCGYADASPCGHEHGGACVTRTLACGHAHGRDCGYAQAAPCGHSHGEACITRTLACGHVHDADCGYAQAAACGHAHDADCGYAEAMPCAHAHDAACAAALGHNEGDMNQGFVLTSGAVSDTYTVYGDVYAQEDQGAKPNRLSGVPVHLVQGDGVLQSTVTHVGGYYSFSSVFYGDYTLVTEAGTYDGVTYGAASVGVSVSSDNVQKDIVLVVEDVPSVHTVSGAVLEAGTLTRLSGVPIKLMEAGGGGQSTTSGDGGSYGFASVPQGDYTLVVEAGTYDGVYYDTVSVDITVYGGDVEQDITLARGAAPVTYSVSGNVSSPGAGYGLPNVPIKLMEADGGEQSTTSDDLTGNYAFTSVSNGDYTLVVEAGIYSGVYYEAVSVDIIVVSGDVKQNITLTRGNAPGTYSVSGSVLAIGVSRLSDVPIKLIVEGGLPQSTTSGHRGRYAFTSLSNGNYTLVVEAGIYSGVYYEAASVDITVDDGDAEQDIELARGNAPGTYSVSGYVSTLGPWAMLLPGVPIKLIGEDDLPQLTTSGLGGKYTFYSVSNGFYTLVTEAGTYGGVYYAATSVGIAVVGGDVSQDITLGKNTGIEAYTISGSVGGDMSPMGLTGISVKLTRDGATVQSTTSGISGIFAFTVPDGDYTLVVEAGSHNGIYHNGASIDITVEDGNAEQDIYLETAAVSLSGTVVSASTGEPVKGVLVLLSSGGVRVDLVATDENGGYAFGELARGSYVLETASGLYGGLNYEATSRGITLTAGEITEQLQLIPTDDADVCYVTGQVVDKDSGLGLGQVQVALISEGAVLKTYLSSSPDGIFTFYGIAPGEYTLAVAAGKYGGVDYGAYSTAITLPPGNTSPTIALQSVEAQGPYTVSGAVSDRGGAGTLAGVLVRLLQGDTEIARATSGEGGQYLLEGIASGDYTLRADGGTYNGAHYIGVLASVSVTDQSITYDFALPTGNVPGTYGVSGLVVEDGSGQALAGVPVTLMDGVSLTVSETTNGQGVYAFYNVAPGAYTLSVPADTYGGTAYRALTQAIAVEDEGLTVQIGLIPVSRLMRPGKPTGLSATHGDGQLTLRWNAPESDGGAAIAYYEVSTDDSNWARADDSVGRTHVFTGLTNGTGYSLFVRAVNSEGAGDAARVTAVPSSGEAVYIVSGVVWDATSRGYLSGVPIDLIKDDIAVQSTTSGVGGVYTFPPVPNGDYTLAVEAGNYGGFDCGAASVDITVSGGNVIRIIELAVEVTPGIPETPDAYSVSGYVIVAASGKGLSGVPIKLIDEGGGERSTTSDTNGNYAFASVSNGAYTLVTEAGLYGGVYYEAASYNVEVSGGNVSVPIFPRKGVAPVANTIRGIVRNTASSDYGLSGVPIKLIKDGRVVQTATSGLGGGYAFASVQEGGDYTLTVEAGTYGGANYAAASVDISVSGDVYTTIVLTGEGASKAYTVHGVVWETIPSYWVMNVPIKLMQGSHVVQSTTSGDRGSYVFTSVSNGDYTLVVEAGIYDRLDCNAASVGITVKDGDVQKNIGLTIRGRNNGENTTSSTGQLPSSANTSLTALPNNPLAGNLSLDDYWLVRLLDPNGGLLEAFSTFTTRADDTLTIHAAYDLPQYAFDIKLSWLYLLPAEGVDKIVLQTDGGVGLIIPSDLLSSPALLTFLHDNGLTADALTLGVALERIDDPDALEAFMAAHPDSTLQPQLWRLTLTLYDADGQALDFDFAADTLATPLMMIINNVAGDQGLYASPDGGEVVAMPIALGENGNVTLSIMGNGDYAVADGGEG